MRKAVKLSLIQLCESILELHMEVLKLKSMKEIINYFSMCQDGAVMIGETLEKEEESYDAQIQLLEKYCDDLFLLAQKSKLDLKKSKEMSDAIYGLYTFIQEIPHILEVAFYPYQSAMWDSLESVYTAFSKREDCHCTVVPIPYAEYQKKDDTWNPCYDGHRMPFMIPITSYKEYDVAVHQPDIAFIHNPYDDANLVTRVDEMFYSFNLKKYVETLIYIPYYATTEQLSSKSKLDATAHYYVDAFIVQSETMKAMYKDMPYHEKIVPLGSPKFDKIIQYCRDGGYMPEDWKPILEGKKTLMLNTTIAPFLKWGEHILDKLMYIFKIVEQRKDVALIWRPHPLLESTIHSMRSEIQWKYEEVTRYFIDHKIGVLDKTPDITNTVALSDGYIGDHAGSVPNLFSIAKKPIFILYYFLLKEATEEEKRKIELRCFQKVGEDIYALPNQHGGLFKVSSDLKNLSYEGVMTEENAWVTPYADMALVGDKLYFATLLGKYLTSYSIEDKKYNIIEKKQTVEEQWFHIVPYQDKIIYIPFKGNEIKIYDITTKKNTMHEIGIVSLEEQKNDIYAAKIENYCISDSQIFFCVSYHHKVIQFDLETKEYRLLPIGDENNGYCCIMKDGDFLWLAEKRGGILRYHMKTKEIQVLKQHNEQVCRKYITNGINRAYMDFCSIGNFLILTPSASDAVVKVNKETLEVRSIFREELKKEVALQKFQGKVIKPVIYFHCLIDDTHMITYLPHSKELVKMDIINEVFEKYELQLSEEDYQRLMSDLDKDTKGFEKLSAANYFCKKESIYHSFTEFCSDLLSNELDVLIPIQQKYNEEISENIDGTCGEKICEFALKRYRQKM